MAAAESSVSYSSAEAITYALSKLGKSELVLNEENRSWLFFLFSGREYVRQAAHSAGISHQ